MINFDFIYNYICVHLLTWFSNYSGISLENCDKEGSLHVDRTELVRGYYLV